MKTNVILKSVDRDLFGVKISQNSKGEFLSITELQKAYEKARWIYGWTDKRINDVMSNESTKERVFYILKERGLIKAEFPAFMEMVNKETLLRVLKGLGLWKTTGRGDNKMVMCDPYIWVMLCLELNPMIYAKVIMWLSDGLIMNRIEAGGEYLPMNKAINSIIDNPNYPEYSKLINKKVFQTHISGMRNLASASELREIYVIEKQIIKAIEMGWIKSENDLINYLN